MLYKHVKSTVYRARTSGSRKSINPVLSVKLWMQEIEKQGGKGTYVDKVTGIDGNYFFAWSTEFQLEVCTYLYVSIMHCLVTHLPTKGSIVLSLRCLPGHGEKQWYSLHGLYTQNGEVADPRSR
jgi:hypothetical protein